VMLTRSADACLRMKHSRRSRALSSMVMEK
jgi:hypothetical protein